MVGKPRVLVVDDDTTVLSLLQMGLNKAGFEVHTASSGLSALRAAYETHPDAVILDIVMPGMDGFEVCRRLREMTDACILFASARGETEDIVSGLQVGGDDYIVKPYVYDELVARLTTCLKRRADRDATPRALRLSAESLLLTDPSRHQVIIDQRTVQLTPKEFELLAYLINHSGKVISNDAILANVWGAEYQGEYDLVKQYIYRLRTKLEPDASNPRYLITVRGSGYAFEPDTRPGKPKGVTSSRLLKANAIHRRSIIPPYPGASRAGKARHRPGSLDTTDSGRMRSHRTPTRPLRHPISNRLPKSIRVGTAILAFLVGAGAGYASGDALPGDALYPLKTGLEDLQLSFSQTKGGDAQLHLKFAVTRADEIVSLITIGRFQNMPESVEDFERQIRLAAQVLGALSTEDPENAEALATAFERAMAQKIDFVADLQVTAPDEAVHAIGGVIATLRLGRRAVQGSVVRIPSPISDDAIRVGPYGAEAADPTPWTGGAETGTRSPDLTERDRWLDFTSILRATGTQTPSPSPVTPAVTPRATAEDGEGQSKLPTTQQPGDGPTASPTPTPTRTPHHLPLRDLRLPR